MRRFTIYFPAIALLVLTSMIGPEAHRSRQRSADQTASLTAGEQLPGRIEKGMIAIKLKAGMEAIPSQKGGVTLQVESLDELSEEWGVEL